MSDAKDEYLQKKKNLWIGDLKVLDQPTNIDRIHKENCVFLILVGKHKGGF